MFEEVLLFPYKFKLNFFKIKLKYLLHFSNEMEMAHQSNSKEIVMESKPDTKVSYEMKKTKWWWPMNKI